MAHRKFNTPVINGINLLDYPISDGKIIQLFENQIDENLLTKEMLAEKCSLSVSYINKLMRQDKIPYIKNGKSVRFIYSDVVAALQKGSAA